MTSENMTQTKKQGFWQRAWPYLTIALVTFITHGFLLLMDWTFWEGAFNYPIIVSRDPAQMDIWTMQAIPIFIPFLLMLGAFSNAFWASHFVAFLSFLAIGLLVYAICHTSKLMRRGESLWIALLTVLYPVFQLAVVNTIVAYLFGYALFLAGVLLALRMESATGWRRQVQRGLALLLLLAGMNFPAIPVCLLFRLPALLPVLPAQTGGVYPGGRLDKARPAAAGFYSAALHCLGHSSGFLSVYRLQFL